MNINVQVQLAEGDQPTMTSDEAAAAVLAALNGDPAKDTCWVNLYQAPISGSAGNVPPPIEPPPTPVSQPTAPTEHGVFPPLDE